MQPYKRTTIFLKILDPSPSDKPAYLEAATIKNTNMFQVSELDLRAIPNSPFVYDITSKLRSSFKKLDSLKQLKFETSTGGSTKDDFKYLRLRWEVRETTLASSRSESSKSRWVRLSKGGRFGRFYADLYLVIDWRDDGKELKKFLANYREIRGWGPHWTAELKGHGFYFKAGLTWPRRTNGLSIRILPDGCIFSEKSPSVFYEDNPSLLSVCALMNSSTFRKLVELQLARKSLAQSFEIGLVDSTPIPANYTHHDSMNLANLYYLNRRSLDTATETSHALRLPWLLQFPGETLAQRLGAYGAFVAQTEAELAHLQDEIDELAFDLYELSEEDRGLIRAESGAAPTADADLDATEDMAEPEEDTEGEEEEDAVSGADLSSLSRSLLSWCVGAAFGRWDVRMAQDPSLIPELQGPFERLPVVAPAGLVGVDGSPASAGQVAPVDWLRARPNVISLPEGKWQNTTAYPLPVAWNGVLVSDPSNPLDLAARVRQVLNLLFGKASESIEDEALRAIRGEAKRPMTLEEYLTNPKFFFAHHLKGYSRSRRKAPIYWPILHPDAPSFVVWIYYPAMRAETLPRLLTEVLGPRIDLARAEVDRTSAARDGTGGSGPQFTQLTKHLESAQELLKGLEALQTEVRRLVDAGYTPEHDDGAIITASPLHAIFPWKDLAAMFRNVQGSKYPWSHQHTLWVKNQESET